MKCCLMTMGLLGLAVSGVLAQEKKAVPPPPKPAPDGAAAAKSAKPLTLKTQKDKFSYAIGMKMGENFKKQSISVDPAILARGLKDGTASGKTLLTDDEAQDVIKEMQVEAQKNQEQKKQAQGTTNQQEGDAFLAANQGKEGVVTLPSGLQYKVLIEGTGPRPTASDTVACNYRGTLVNGKEFDSSYKRGQPTSFPVSAVIKGWTEALQAMPVGSKWQLFIPPSLAYGERGAGNDIGPNATLIFEVELLSIEGQTGQTSEAQAAASKCNALDQVVEIEDAMPSGSGHCAGEADFWFTNTSGQAIDCAIIFHKNGRFDPGSVLTFSLKPGEKLGGTGKISTCGADSGKMQYQCFAHAESAPDSCTGKVQWQQ
jgi:FKBP-type peptidyl-prolyl cis-trans isomerase FklB